MRDWQRDRAFKKQRALDAKFRNRDSGSGGGSLVAELFTVLLVLVGYAFVLSVKFIFMAIGAILKAIFTRR